MRLHGKIVFMTQEKKKKIITIDRIIFSLSLSLFVVGMQFDTITMKMSKRSTFHGEFAQNYSGEMASSVIDLEVKKLEKARREKEKQERMEKQEGKEMDTYRSGVQLRNSRIPGYIPPARLSSVKKVSNKEKH